ncbi:hypothetical protein C7974DRAFT_12783 [Boeremia exigua]|uniref:uncharacterized protein n=1 Tax=Boeremia exigua TaxID=749465 RepID=UPI001E8D9A56|nr:uncharacterized protein C7974DRAFT_12783 [Boeremia exigua]KAH6644024.1 hypothetical protein C7974DRAFT_12783 [Boeremia exigua]
MARNSGDSASRCFQSDYGYYNKSDYAMYACMVVMLALYLGTVIALCVVRRKTGPGKHLIGIPYMLALLFMFIEQALAFISATLLACEISVDIRRIYDTNIAINVFSGINTFLLLFVVIYTLNTMLRKQLGHNPSSLRIALGIDLFVLGSLLLSSVVLVAYLYWHFSRAYFRGYISISPMSPLYVTLAFSAVFLISILASGALSIAAARSLKKRNSASNSFVAWIAVLIALLFGNSLLNIIMDSLQVSSIGLRGDSYVAMAWMSSIFRGLAYITIIIIAKNPAWRSNREQPHAYIDQHEAPAYHGMSQRV